MTDIKLDEQTEPADEPNGAPIAAAIPVEGGIAEHMRTYLQRVRGGDMGSLPAIVGLVVLSVFFWAVHPSFGSLGNFANLTQQAASSIFIAMGLVFVLLLGEIDLAAGTAAGVCAAVMARMSVGYGWGWPASIAAAMVTGIVIGFITGWLCAKIRIPSFVVTLALFLAFQGVVLYIVNNGKGTHGNLSITDNFINGLDNGQMANWAGWLVVAILVIGYAAVKVQGAMARAKAGLLAEPYSLVAIKVGALAAFSVLAVYLLNKNRATNREPTIVNQGTLQLSKSNAVAIPGPLIIGDSTNAANTRLVIPDRAA